MENQREHYIEKKRAGEFGRLLYNDLIKDSSVLSNRTRFMKQSVVALDTLIQLLNHQIQDSNHVSKIYNLSAYAFAGAFFQPNTSAINQLKNSGSLRYFANEKLISKFSSYDSQIDALRRVDEMNAYITQEIRTFLTHFLNLKYLSRVGRNSKEPIILSHPAVQKNMEIFKPRPERMRQMPTGVV